MTGDTPIGPGCRVEMRFRLSLADGTLVDGTEEGEPLRFVLGDGTLAAGLEALLLGLRAGDRVQREFSGSAAFGEPDPGNVHLLPLAEFPPDLEVGEGAVVAFETPGGLTTTGTVRALLGESAVVDFNHPLAGRDLHLDASILAVATPAR